MNRSNRSSLRNLVTLSSILLLTLSLAFAGDESKPKVFEGGCGAHIRAALESQSQPVPRQWTTDELVEELRSYVGNVEYIIDRSTIEIWQNNYRVTRDELLFALSVVAADRTYSPVSNFPVGAVGLSDKGDAIMGANIEFPNGDLGLTMHAERSVLAIAHETNRKIVALYSSVTPCGNCRQWLTEVVDSEKMRIVSKDESGHLFETTLEELFPNAFNPRHLGQEGMLNGEFRRWDVHGLLIPYSSGLIEEILRNQRSSDNDLLMAALSLSYAKNSGQPAGALITLKNGRRFTGSYIEQVAYESFSPLQVALVKLFMGGNRPEEITSIRVASANDYNNNVNHEAMNELIWQSSMLQGLGIEYRYFQVPQIINETDYIDAKKGQD